MQDGLVQEVVKAQEFPAQWKAEFESSRRRHPGFRPFLAPGTLCVVQALVAILASKVWKRRAPQHARLEGSLSRRAEVWFRGEWQRTGDGVVEHFLCVRVPQFVAALAFAEWLRQHHQEVQSSEMGDIALNASMPDSSQAIEVRSQFSGNLFLFCFLVRRVCSLFIVPYMKPLPSFILFRTCFVIRFLNSRCLFRQFIQIQESTTAEEVDVVFDICREAIRSVFVGN